MTAFQATYSDWKLIRSRKVVQVVLEVPIEQADEAYQVLGGMPNPASETWVGVARLTLTPMDEQGNFETPAATVPVRRAVEEQFREAPTEAAPRPRKSFAELSPAQQAGIACNEPRFWAFLREKMCRGEVIDTTSASIAVRALCGVSSRTQIKPGNAAADLWGDLYGSYQAWLMVPA